MPLLVGSIASGRPIRLSAAVALLLTAGCSQHRPTPSESQLLNEKQAYNQVLAQQLLQRNERIVARLEREYDEFAAGRSTTPPTVDVLILSGGGEFGAFGAGFLKGWGAVKDPAWARPQFDLVSGVSTGALIAPFAFVGDARAYDRILKLYENPKADWVKPRGLLFFLPGNPSLLTLGGLEQELRTQVNADLVHAIADGSRDARVLCVASTNLDYGEQRIFDVGAEAEAVAPAGDCSRIHQMLLASSAIPGAFPPRIIDGCMYVDGGVTSNILYNPDMNSPESGLALWRRKHPDRSIPRQRVWVIIDEQFDTAPKVVQPTWVSVAGASVELMIRSSTHTSLRQLADEAALIRSTTGAQIEVRYVDIPGSWKDPASDTGMFDKRTMDSLASLGIKMGADPSSWKSFDSTAVGAHAARPATRS